MARTFETTPRGFKVYGRVTDSRGTDVSIIESSAVGRPHAHVYVDPSNATPHLDVEQAKSLVAVLQAFVEDAEDPANWRNAEDYKETWG